jgi:putative hydrolase of the HAD superfamily
MEAFHLAFQGECDAAGHTISAADLMLRISECRPRPEMVHAIRRIRARSLGVAALTNNWSVRPSDEPSSEPGGDDELRQEFDVFVESSVVGLRKPDPRIYTHVCEELGVGPSDAVFLDDIGRNLKTARSLGMRTIKVDDPGTALEELSAQLGFTLG